MKSVRDRETFNDMMLKYKGELKRLVDAAKILCSENAQTSCDCKNCSFSGLDNGYCIVDIIADELEME